MKIIKNNFYSTSKAWDTTGGTYGSSNWDRPASLKTELNGSSFYGNTNYIDERSKSYIAETTWYTGGQNTDDLTLASFEDNERNNSSKGKIGLMSITDFSYASNNVSCGRATNLNEGNNACKWNNYLYFQSAHQWTITPSSNTSSLVWYAYKFGGIGSTYATSTIGVRPSLFLKSEVKIIDGIGTQTEPYRLSL